VDADVNEVDEATSTETGLEADVVSNPAKASSRG
jgi:hypothetical protein